LSFRFDCSIAVEYQIRDCRDSDLTAISEIERLSFDEPYPYSLFIAFLADFPMGFRVAVASGDEKIVGYCILSPSGDSETLIIASIAVHPSFRRVGVGKALVEDSIRIAKGVSQESAVRRIVLQVNSKNLAAQSLYEKLGFSATKNLMNYYGFRKHGIQMERQIK
jgi:[ribosomal protein S18]-alanine N-acetyltransferase